MLLLLTGSKWHWWSSAADLLLAGQVAPFGAAIYGTAMFLLERMSRMFWALAQRKKDIEKWRQEGREERERELLRQASSRAELD